MGGPWARSARGSWVAPKNPDLFAAIATFAGSGAPGDAERIATMPEFIVHGDADPTVNVAGRARWWPS